MMGRICLALSLPFLLGGTQSELPENWSVFTSKDGGFSAKLPSARTEMKQQVKTAAGQVLHVTKVVAEGRNDTLLVVTYTDYAEADLKKGSIEKRLDHARDAAVTIAGGKVVMEKAIDLKGHPGREFAIEKKGETIARVRIYLMKRRLYQVMVLGTTPTKEATKEATIFLDSFALNE